MAKTGKMEHTILLIFSKSLQYKFLRNPWIPFQTLYKYVVIVTSSHLPIFEKDNLSEVSWDRIRGCYKILKLF